MVEGRGIDAIFAISYSSSHAGHDSPNPLLGGRAWIRDCPAARTDLQILRPGESGIAVSRASPAGTEGLVEGRLETIGNRTRSQVLFIDALRAKAAPCRKR